MLAGRPQARFLLRGSALLIALLTLWWFVLLTPLLFLLRGSVEIFGSLLFGGSSQALVTETANGDWSLRVPMEVVIPDTPQQPGPTKLHSIDFDVARSDVIAFTFSLPLYWAITLAAPGIRRSIRPLALGSLLVGVLEIVLFLMFMEIFAHNIAGQWSQSQSGLGKWFLHFGNYLVVSVIPYVAPLLIAISLHQELRRQVFGAVTSPEASEGVRRHSGKQARRP